MKKTLKLGVFLMGVGIVLSSVSFVLAKPGEIDFARVLKSNLADNEVRNKDITPNPNQMTTDNIHGLKVVSDSFDITVKTGNEFSVTEIASSENGLFESHVVDHQLLVGPKSAKTGKALAGTTRIEIKVPSGAKLDNITVQTKNGDIKLQQIYANQVQLTNTNGDIELKQVTINGGGSVTNTNGDIEVEQSQLPIVEAETKLGSLSMKRAYRVGYGDGANLHLMNQSGDVELD